jgi:hypothetical protein
LQLAGGARGLLGGLLTQRVGAHHDPLAVARDDQQIGVVGRRSRALLVEGVEVDGGARGELLDLALAQPLPGRPLERVDGVIERAARGLDRGQSAQPVRVLLDRQAQARVGRTQVAMAALPIRQPRHRDGPEHGPQRPLMPGLGRAARHAVSIDDALDAPLAQRAQVDMVLHQLAQQRAALGLHPVLEVGVRHVCRLRAAQEPDQPVKQPARPVKRARRRVVLRRGHARVSPPRRPPSATARCTLPCQGRNSSMRA